MNTRPEIEFKELLCMAEERVAKLRQDMKFIEDLRKECIQNGLLKEPNEAYRRMVENTSERNTNRNAGNLYSDSDILNKLNTQNYFQGKVKKNGIIQFYRGARK